ncbi:DedA family protein [Streptomyces lydicus]|uniref:DedA family protein n=1 Tax=Streptomyces lydicus TaxID=47763 RepID=UPI0009977378|nr:DedA family protein [Streptomyces lydicus]UEG91606.1 DedA family protein [Streptomyces lydicus]
MDVLALYGLLVLTTLPPLVPNSALLVSAGVLASRGELFLPQVILAVAVSALLGDLLMYLAARRFGGPVRTWMRRNPRRRALLEWTAQRVERYGLPFVVAVRFLPSGRIAGALAAGVLRYPWRKYALGAGIAELTWATYSIGLGYLGSAAVHNRLHAVGIGLGVSCVVAAAGTAIQWAARRRALRERPDRSGERDGEGRDDRAPLADRASSAPRFSRPRFSLTPDAAQAPAAAPAPGAAGPAVTRTSATATGAPVRRDRSQDSAT